MSKLLTALRKNSVQHYWYLLLILTSFQADKTTNSKGFFSILEQGPVFSDRSVVLFFLNDILTKSEGVLSGALVTFCVTIF